MTDTFSPSHFCCNAQNTLLNVLYYLNALWCPLGCARLNAPHSPIQQPLPSFPPFFPPCCCVVLARVEVDGKRGDGRTDGRGIERTAHLPRRPRLHPALHLPHQPAHDFARQKSTPPPPSSVPFTQVGCMSGSNYWGARGELLRGAEGAVAFRIGRRSRKKC